LNILYHSLRLCPKASLSRISAQSLKQINSKPNYNQIRFQNPLINRLKNQKTLCIDIQVEEMESQRATDLPNLSNSRFISSPKQHESRLNVKNCTHKIIWFVETYPNFPVLGFKPELHLKITTRHPFTYNIYIKGLFIVYRNDISIVLYFYYFINYIYHL